MRVVALTLLALVCLARPLHAAGPPQVVVTIAPLHSLAASVMAGVGEPALLLPAGVSPHSWQMRPSEARRLAGAELVVRVGSSFERFLDRTLASLAPAARVLDILQLSLPVRLPLDTGDPHAHDGSDIDPHVWLDPANAAAIGIAIADALAELEPANADLYRRNASKLAARLERLRRELDDVLAPVRDRGFATAHDAFRYFAHAFRLRLVGAFAVDPELPGGAARVAELRRRARDGTIRCLVVEPQFTPRGIDLLARETGLAVAVLDPLGAGLPPGPALYEQMMRANADALADCLGRSG